MLLTFKRESFVQAIIDGVKIHTIRPDKTRRWKEGMKIHFWKGNPRNVKHMPYQFGHGEVWQIWTIDILENEVTWRNNDGEPVRIIWDKKHLNQFAVSDGFKDWKAMKLWFPGEHLDMRIIYWKDFQFMQPTIK